MENNTSAVEEDALGRVEKNVEKNLENNASAVGEDVLEKVEKNVEEKLKEIEKISVEEIVLESEKDNIEVSVQIKDNIENFTIDFPDDQNKKHHVKTEIEMGNMISPNKKNGPNKKKECTKSPSILNEPSELNFPEENGIDYQNAYELAHKIPYKKKRESIKYESETVPETWDICMVFKIGSDLVKKTFRQRLWNTLFGSEETDIDENEKEKFKWLQKTQVIIERLQIANIEYTLLKDDDHVYLLLGMHDKNLIEWAIKEKYLLRLHQKHGREYGKKINFILADADQKDELWENIWIRIHKNGIERNLYDYHYRNPAKGFSLCYDAHETESNNQSVFSTKDRISLIYRLLLNDEESGGCYFTLDSHIRDPNHPLERIFPLHQKAELTEVAKYWAFCRCCMAEVPEDPITCIVKNYYGESVGFYLEFQLFFVWRLVILLPGSFGLCFIYFLNGWSMDSHAVVPFFFVFCLWPILFCEGWKRKEGEIRSLWGTSAVKTATELKRPEFIGKLSINEVTGRVDAVYNQCSRFFRLTVSFFINFTYLITVMALTGALMSYRCGAVSKDPNSLAPMFIGFLTSLQIIIFDYIYTLIISYLTIFENHRTQQEHENAFISKSFTIRFLNGFMSLYWIAFIQPYFWSDQYKDEDGNILFGRTFQDRIMVDLAQQTLFLFSSLLVVNNIQELLLPRILRWISQKMSAKDTYANTITKQANKQVYDTTLDDMSEVVMVFGYVSLFIFANPLLPFLGILFALIEWYVDRNKFLKVYQRPFPKGRDGIGGWKNCLKIISYISILTNMALLTWRTSQIADTFGPEYKLSFFIICSLFVICSILILEILISDVSIKTNNRMQRQLEMERALIFDEGGHYEFEDYMKSTQKINLDNLPNVNTIDEKKFSQIFIDIPDELLPV